MLAGLVLFMPGKVQAGCAHDSPTVGYFELLVEVGALEDTGDSSEPWKPCSGPQCKNGQGIPPGAPLPVLIVKCCAVLDDLCQSHFKATAALAVDQVAVIPTCDDSQIFHPPRLAR
jgi:hypothetical protein